MLKQITRRVKIARLHGVRTALLLSLAACTLRLSAAEMAWTFEPPQCQVHWTLDTALHQVHGTFRLKSGRIVVDPASGKAGGALIVDATSGESGNESRDKRMHTSILESQKYTEIVFTPDRIEGTLAPQGSSTLQLHGRFRLMNAEHEMTVPVKVDAQANQIAAVAKFTVPYIRWGLKNPSVLFLHVSDHVDIEIQGVGHPAAPLNASR